MGFEFFLMGYIEMIDGEFHSKRIKMDNAKICSFVKKESIKNVNLIGKSYKGGTVKNVQWYCRKNMVYKYKLIMKVRKI